ncbi:MAG: hypothetical protein KGR98_15430, partial [Verrucomicrobia bacterium]|nr:hypothetical protein [Verrucomicrobiota bacterium]
MIRRAFAKLARIRIVPELSHGADVFGDIAKRLPEFKTEVIFDVGANIGQSAVRFARRVRNARLF